MVETNTWRKLGFVVLVLLGGALSLTRELGTSWGARLLAITVMSVGFIGYFHFSSDKK